ncbi:MAG: acyltransferase family protein [Leptothrix sp. (in: b-proteobacteria)]
MRYYGLDFARALLMIMGIAYHTALIYAPAGQQPWRVAAVTTHPFFTGLAQFIHDFRMFAFYIISGFFLSLLIGKSGTKQALSNRWIRLGIPLVFCGLTINTLMNLLSHQWRFHLGSTSELSVYFLQGEWLGHLWFIGNLLAYCCVGVVLDRALRRIRHLANPQTGSALLLIGTTVLAAIILAQLGHRIASNVWIFISFDPLFLYFPFFILGMVLWHNKALFAMLTEWRLTLPLLVFSVFLLTIYNRIGSPAGSYTASQLVHVFYQLTLALFILSVFCHFKHPNQLAKKFSMASYTIYLLHQPLVIVLFSVAQAMSLGPFAGFVFICLATTALTYLIHVTVVDASPLAACLLNGKVPPAYARTNTAAAA